ncbi:MAG: ATP phosphoribosyltransferase [Gammaproteobacteria bacterium]
MSERSPAPDRLRLAVSKGRILEQALPLLARAGIVPGEDPGRTRKLIWPTSRPDIDIVVIRAADVPTYVDMGAADLGITGKDVLLEHTGEGLYEPLDLGIARCALVVAGRPDATPAGARLRVATKYVQTTRRYYAARSEQVEVIHLYGSMELAPLVGLADRIVDLVDTGNTLRANGLAPLEHIADISSRLVVNKAAFKIKHARIRGFVDEMRAAVAAGRA